MKSVALLEERKAIDLLIAEISHFNGDPFISAQLTYFLCIRISGFIENCVRIIFTAYSTPRVKDHVTNFVSKRLEKLPNPTYEAICKLTGDFNDSWLKSFKATVSEQNRSALQSINVNRNAIAHGDTSSITLHQLTNYYVEVLDLLEKLESTCV